MSGAWQTRERISGVFTGAWAHVLRAEKRLRGLSLFRRHFNTENEDTDYQSGTQAFIDGTLAQHFPLFGGLAGAGVSAYYYKQVTADSGDGATLGDFKGKTVGLGPVVSFVTKILDRDTIFELKWLHEVEAENRLKGDIVWFKAVYKF